jgi:hypothetical protein
LGSLKQNFDFGRVLIKAFWPAVELRWNCSAMFTASATTEQNFQLHCVGVLDAARFEQR